MPIEDKTTTTKKGEEEEENSISFLSLSRAPSSERVQTGVQVILNKTSVNRISATQ